MQTFLPYPDYKAVAQVLDMKRLGKQRVEAYQILKTNRRVALEEPGAKIAWCNHPAVLMWRGYERELCKYGLTMCTEWVRRGYKDNLSGIFKEGLLTSFEEDKLPPWYGNEKLYSSHRSKLLEKNREHYSKYFFNPLEEGLPYYWPSLIS